MSVVTVQLGQCGNQIGGQLFSTYIEDLQSCSATGKQKNVYELYTEESHERFFYKPESGGIGALKYTCRNLGQVNALKYQLLEMSSVNCYFNSSYYILQIEVEILYRRLELLWLTWNLK